MFATYDITLFLKIVKAAFCEKKKCLEKDVVIISLSINLLPQS